MSHPSSNSPAPSPLKRLVYFVIFGIIGGVIGYGILTSGPGPAPSMFEIPGAYWVFGGALVCGLLAAASPEGVWRRRWDWTRRDRDE